MNKYIDNFYCCTVHFDNIKILFTNKCTLYYTHKMLKYTVKISLYLLLHVSVHLDHPQGLMLSLAKSTIFLN